MNKVCLLKGVMRGRQLMKFIIVFGLWILFCVYSIIKVNMIQQTQQRKATVGGINNEINNSIKVSEKNKRYFCKGCVDYTQYHVIIEPQLQQSPLVEDGTGTGSNDLDLLIVVPSSYRRDAAERRAVIRRTWANRAHLLPEFNTKHVFVMGEFIICIYNGWGAFDRFVKEGSWGGGSCDSL